jgi:hypothetical protein
MSMLGRYTKATGETLSYSIDYSADLDTGDTLTGTSAAVTGTDTVMTVVSAVYIENGTTHISKVKLAGGTVGVKYTVTVTTTTQAGAVFVDTFTVTIK